MGLGNDLGAIEPGKLADAVLLDANPLEDLAVIIRPGHLVTTFVEGEPATVAA
ncbi:MAG TPA: amidohydrolase family protein [Chloroflexota bacterium]